MFSVAGQGSEVSLVELRVNRILVNTSRKYGLSLAELGAFRVFEQHKYVA